MIEKTNINLDESPVGDIESGIKTAYIGRDSARLNSEAFSFLKEHPELIPEKWKGKKISSLNLIWLDGKWVIEEKPLE